MLYNLEMVLNYNLIIIRSLATPASSYVIYKTSGIIEKHDYLNVKIIFGIDFCNPFVPISIYLGVFLSYWDEYSW